MGSAFSKKKKDKKAQQNDRLQRRLTIAGGGMAQDLLSGDPLAVQGQSSDQASNKYLRYASLSNAGYEPDGGKKTNQDAFVSIAEFADPSVSVFAVFDGHGAVGHVVSAFCTRQWPENLDKALIMREAQEPGECSRAFAQGGSPSMRAMLEKSFNDTHNQLEKDRQIDSSLSGTTAVGGLVYGPPGRRVVAMANAGDSRAVIATERHGQLICTPLSDDQKPDRPDERERIERCGGRVEPLFDEDGEAIGPARVWLANMMLPGLAMARSLGDNVAGSVGVTAHPEVHIHALTPADKFMVLASDGVWEFLDSEQVIEIVKGCDGDEVKAAKALCDKAYELWKQEEEVVDDITAIVVFFNN